jgi:hypothetical protein
MRRPGVPAVLLSLFLATAAAIAAWLFVAVPWLYWETREAVPASEGCRQLVVVFDDTTIDANSSPESSRETSAAKAVTSRAVSSYASIANSSRTTRSSG